MGEAHYHARLVWSGGALGPTKSVECYSREFRAEFEGKPPFRGSADPAFHGDPALYNPEDLLVSALGVPSLATIGSLAVVIGLLLLASLGLGLLIAVVSDSERQAVQLSLLTLLASVFFSGFVLAIDQFTPPVRALAYLLPVTHGIQLLQDLMLRGTSNHLWQLGALAAIAAVTLVGAWLLLRRNMRTA